MKTELAVNAASVSNMPVLIVTSVASMIDQFNITDIKLLTALGYSVDVAANFIYGSTCTNWRIQKLLQVLDQMGVDCYQIDFDRNVLDIKADIAAFRQLDCVVRGTSKPLNAARHHQVRQPGGYVFVHAHSPIGGVIGRMVAKRYGIRTVYTAHGFHFYTGAPKKNWMLFYPAEQWLSCITDVLITINKEDYKRAKKRFHAKKVVYIPGIGIDLEKFSSVTIDREKKRKDLGVKKEDILLFSVGELNRNKNHRVVIEALGNVKPEISCHVHYFIAGIGELKDELRRLAERFGVNLHLLGFRSDIPELLKAADIFLLPSIREGLNVSLMEAMAAGLPALVSDIRGNQDLIPMAYRVKTNDAADWEKKIETYIANRDTCTAGKENQQKISRFSEERVRSILSAVYTSLLERVML